MIEQAFQDIRRALIVAISLTAASEGEKTHQSITLFCSVYDWSGATKTAVGSPEHADTIRR